MKKMIKLKIKITFRQWDPKPQKPDTANRFFQPTAIFSTTVLICISYNDIIIRNYIYNNILICAHPNQKHTHTHTHKIKIKMERKILIAVDEGEESSYALSWSLKNIIDSSKDTLILLYAKPPRTLYPAGDGTGFLFTPDVIASMERYGNEVAASVIHKAKRLCRDYPQVKVETKVECGDARDVICEAAEKLNVDIVVVGSHGYGAFKRAFLGSVSNHCAQNIKCPVLIVKKPKSPTSPPPASGSTASAGKE